MELTFRTPKLAKLCNSSSALSRSYGRECADRIGLRLQQLEAAETLADMHFGRPHELKGDRAGQVSVDLVGALRLIIKPTEWTGLPAGGLDRGQVKAVTVIEIADTH